MTTESIKYKYCSGCCQMRPDNGDWEWRYDKSGKRTHKRCNSCKAHKKQFIKNQNDKGRTAPS